LNQNIKPKFVLGCAQLGMSYPNREKKFSKSGSLKIINYALRRKIKYFDTASNYGESENILGKLNKKNKLFFFTKNELKIKTGLNFTKTYRQINFLIGKSLKKLNQKYLYLFFIHNIKKKKKNKNIIRSLIKLKKIGKIKNIGASIYNVKDLEKIQKFKEISHIQIPFNLLTSSWHKKITKIKKKIIHIRSIFLRGNIKKSFINLKKIKYLSKEQIRNFLQLYKKKNLFELSFAFIKSFKNISYFVIGCKNVNQLRENIKYFNSKALRKIERDKLVKYIKNSGVDKYSDLSKWRL